MRNVSYSREAFTEPEAMILQARAALRNVDYDTMIGTGLSGALMIPTLARALGKKWAIVRKPGESSHADWPGYEGEIGERWIFVDDFIASGTTRNRVIEKVGDVYGEARELSDQYPGSYPDPGPAPVYVGDYLYAMGGSNPGFRPRAERLC